jgi:hypothetical protein
MSLPEKADSKKPPLRRRFSKRRIADALSAASKTGLPIRGFKISPSGEIDVVFGSRAEDQSEDLTNFYDAPAVRASPSPLRPSQAIEECNVGLFL